MPRSTRTCSVSVTLLALHYRLSFARRDRKSCTSLSVSLYALHERGKLKKNAARACAMVVSSERKRAKRWWFLYCSYDLRHYIISLAPYGNLWCIDIQTLLYLWLFSSFTRARSHSYTRVVHTPTRAHITSTLHTVNWYTERADTKFVFFFVFLFFSFYSKLCWSIWFWALVSTQLKRLCVRVCACVRVCMVALDRSIVSV